VTASRTRRALAAAAAAFGGLACAPAADTGPPERVILIVVDTLRRDHLSCYGSSVSTPNIDRIAAGGQIYTNTLASYHQTSMSMGALFSGRTPSIEFGTLGRPLFWNGQSWCGLARFSKEKDEGDCVPADLPTLAGEMSEAGYWSVGIASNQFLYEPSGYSRGFDDWVEVGEHPEQKGALARMELKNAPRTRHWRLVNAAAFDALARRASDRFFLYVHYMDVHDYGFEQITYADAVRKLDAAVGELIDGLDHSGWLDDALIVFTADHGERLRERHAIAGHAGHVGNPTFQEVLRVPLVVSPGVARDPAAPIRTEDIYRLILGAVDAPPQASPELEPGELLLSETEYRTFLRDHWKLVIRREDGAAQLFDLQADPMEMQDLASSRPEIVAALRDRAEELSMRFSARRAVLEMISEEDRARLRALGYDYQD